ncbi:MAG: hypothetical protein D4S02_13290 [Rhodocyclaceae bacterium]|nr:MAG: hypothetical protein D4S02_13290 [Rhodocyclaceae bacterium]
MVTRPVADETPELAPNVPEVALNFTVTPGTGKLFGSTTFAVIVDAFEPSGLIDALELLRMISNAIGDTLTGICPVTLVPTTVAVTVSVRSVTLIEPLGEIAE